jgi:hypothetical protein
MDRQPNEPNEWPVSRLWRLLIFAAAVWAIPLVTLWWSGALGQAVANLCNPPVAEEPNE